MDDPANQSSLPQGYLPLAPGTTVGEYQILELLSSQPGSNMYLARASGGSYPTVHLWEYPAGEDHPLLALARRALNSPALLLPGPPVPQGERLYLPIPAPDDQQPALALRPADALRQIFALGEGLKLLHSQGVAHLHVHPESLVWVGGHLVLGGLETARVLAPDSDDAPFFFARDANFLALTLGALLSAERGSADAALLAAISAIQDRGAEHAYHTVEQVLADCQQALGPSVDAAAALPPAGRPAPPTWTIAAGHATSVGLVRANNEDALGRLELTIVDGLGQPIALGCFVVADGVGGESRGELASHLAAHTILESAARQVALPALAACAGQGAQSAWPPDYTAPHERAMHAALLEGFRAANRAIYAQARAQKQTIATTATALLLVGERAVLAHVGDSRAYRFHQGTLTVLTEDHSIIQRLLRVGQLDAAEAATHPKRHTLYRSLGQQEQIEVDLLACPLEAGDRLLLCTDGLWDAVRHEQLEHLLADHRDSPASAVAAQLVALADAAGGEDNSTVVVVDLREQQAVTDGSTISTMSSEGE